nr:uncharacterized protein LOC113689692 isoform X2 [Coffea arabica]
MELLAQYLDMGGGRQGTCCGSIFTPVAVGGICSTVESTGKYYAVDAAYQNITGLMAPFKGARGTAQKRTVRTLFNKRHASLRNIIERTFGVLKKRFSILKGPMQKYMMTTQNNIVLACCALHNFMREYVPNESYFVEEKADIALTDNINPFNPMPAAQVSNMSAAGIVEWNESRKAIADMMYYHQHQ